MASSGGAEMPQRRARARKDESVRMEVLRGRDCAYRSDLAHSGSKVVLIDGAQEKDDLSLDDGN